MIDIDDAADDQDQAEVYDETHLDDDGDGGLLLDEVNDVPDLTQAQGDSDEEEFDEDNIEIDDQLALDGIEAEADALLGADATRLSESDPDGGGLQGQDEVELVYSGLMENERGAQASAAHWESKRLSDDDIESLGYGAAEEETETAR